MYYRYSTCKSLHCFSIFELTVSLIDVRRPQSESVNSRDVLRVLTSKNDSFSGHDQQVDNEYPSFPLPQLIEVEFIMQDAEELFQTMMSILSDEAKKAALLRPVSGLRGLVMSTSAAPSAEINSQVKCPLEGVLGR